MPIDDEQLDELLRDVSVPRDLKASLLQIPGQDLSLSKVESRSRSRLAIVGALAAIAAMIIVFLNLPTTDVAVNNIEDGEAIESLLAQMQENLDTMDQVCVEFQTEFPRSAVLDVEPALNMEESLSLAMSVSWQSAVDRGASVESVKSELEYVINTYPNTLGAQQARNILQPN